MSTYTTTLEWRSPVCSKELLSSYQHPALTGYFGDYSYMVWCDVNCRPFVTRVSREDQRHETVPLDDDPSYTAVNNSHNRFSIGLDRSGYIHIAGDMHNYNKESTINNPAKRGKMILYWKSNSPYKIKDGFKFMGDHDNKGVIHGNTFSYGRFFNDNNGELYFSARVRAIAPRHATGEMGIALYSYNQIFGTWTTLGGKADNIRDGDYFDVLFWENGGMAPDGWYQGFSNSFTFDSQNRLLFGVSVNTDTKLTGNNRLIFAMSSDKGRTWKHANGKPIPSLPIRAVDNHPNMGDLVAERTKAPFFFNEVRAFADKNGRLGVNQDNKEFFLWDEFHEKWTTDNLQNKANMGQTQGYYGNTHILDGTGGLVVLSTMPRLFFYDDLTKTPTTYYPTVANSKIVRITGIDELTYKWIGKLYVLAIMDDNTQAILHITKPWSKPVVPEHSKLDFHTNVPITVSYPSNPELKGYTFTLKV